jgi:hypothetical protein
LIQSRSYDGAGFSAVGPGGRRTLPVGDRSVKNQETGNPKQPMLVGLRKTADLGLRYSPCAHTNTLRVRFQAQPETVCKHATMSQPSTDQLSCIRCTSRKSVPRRKVENRRRRIERVGPDALVWAAGRQPGWLLLAAQPNRKSTDSSRISCHDSLFRGHSDLASRSRAAPLNFDSDARTRGQIRETVRNDSVTFRARSQPPRQPLPGENAL